MEATLYIILSAAALCIYARTNAYYYFNSSRLSDPSLHLFDVHPRGRISRVVDKNPIGRAKVAPIKCRTLYIR